MRYALIGQTNHRRPHPTKPRTTYLEHRKPDDEAELLKLVEERPLEHAIVESNGDTVPTRWGCLTYLIGDDGSLTYVGNDCDSSG